MASVSLPAIMASIGSAVASAGSAIGSAVGIGSATAATVGAATAGTALASVTPAVGTLAASAGLEGASIATAGAASTLPSWLGAASLASTAVGGITGAIGAIQQGQASAAAARFNSQIEAQNAAIAKQNAAMAGQAGAEQSFQVGEKTRALVGAMTANEAASGIDVNSGSAVEAKASGEELGMLDAMTIRSNAAREAYGYTQQARSDKEQSMLDQFEAKNDITAGWLGGASTFLGAAGSASSNFLKYQLAGGFTG